MFKFQFNNYSYDVDDEIYLSEYMLVGNTRLVIFKNTYSNVNSISMVFTNINGPFFS